MENRLIMTISHSFQSLANNIPDHVFTHSALPNLLVFTSLVFSNQIQDRAFNQLKNEVEISADSDNFFKFHNILVV